MTEEKTYCVVVWTDTPGIEKLEHGYVVRTRYGTYLPNPYHKSPVHAEYKREHAAQNKADNLNRILGVA